MILINDGDKTALAAIELAKHQIAGEIRMGGQSHFHMETMVRITLGFEDKLECS